MTEFLAVPDSPEGAAVAYRVPSGAWSMIPHASDRPWIIGRWRSGEVVHAHTGTRRIVLLGATSITANDATAALKRMSTLADLDAWAATLPGSIHLLASFDGKIRAQGSVSGVRQVFHATVDGVTVIADRQQRLADLVNATVDPTMTALQLLLLAPPWPLNDRPLWQGIQRVPPDKWIEVAPDGRSRTHLWWTIPNADVPLTTASALIRNALAQAVQARIRPSVSLSTDMSGGTDSTSLAFLASQPGRSLLTTRYEAEDRTGDDPFWAGQAAKELPEADHMVIARANVPSNFTDVLAPGPDEEGPFAWQRTRAMLAHHAATLQARGITDHLTGHGGDELFRVTPSIDHSLVRMAPWKYLPHARTNRSLRRWSTMFALTQLADSRSHSRWLADLADNLAVGRPLRDNAWGEAVRMPWWSTAEAVDHVRSVLMATSRQGQAPLSRWRAQHATLDMARQTGSTVRRAARITARHSVSWHAPYLDDRVIEAALSVRFADRVEANAYKPALIAAMRGIVPDHILGRTTKAEFSADVFAGFRLHKKQILDQSEDMHLHRMGLINATAFRSALLRPQVGTGDLLGLLNTLSCEAWLRASIRPRLETEFV